MTIVNWILGLYVLPVILLYLLIRLSYKMSEDELDGEGPSAVDVVFLFFPILNIVFVIILPFIIINEATKSNTLRIT